MNIQLKGMRSGVKYQKFHFVLKLSGERCQRLNSHFFMLCQSKQFHVIMTLHILVIMNDVFYLIKMSCIVFSVRAVMSSSSACFI